MVISQVSVSSAPTIICTRTLRISGRSRPTPNSSRKVRVPTHQSRLSSISVTLPGAPMVTAERRWMQAVEALDELPAAGEAEQQKTPHVDAVLAFDFVDHRQEQQIEAHVVEFQALEIRQLAGLDQADREQRRQHDGARTLGKRCEAVAVSGGRASSAMNGDDQAAGRTVLLVLERLRNIEAVADALVSLQREEGGRADVVEAELHGEGRPVTTARSRTCLADRGRYIRRDPRRN